MEESEKTDIQKELNEPDIFYQQSYTYADYLKFNITEKLELIRGKIFRMSPGASTKHQQISGNLYLQIGNQLKNKSCQAFLPPYDIVLPIQNPKSKNHSNTVVQPDLSVICDISKLDEQSCFGAPDLIIEIISPYTSKKDIQFKFDVYEESGVKEYWVVFPKDEIVEVFEWKDGKYNRKSGYTKEDTIHSESVPGLKVQLNEVF